MYASRFDCHYWDGEFVCWGSGAKEKAKDSGCLSREVDEGVSIVEWEDSSGEGEQMEEGGGVHHIAKWYEKVTKICNGAEFGD